MDVSSLKLFATHEHACSYLPGRLATTVFIDPDAALNQAVYSDLSDFGFRRSGRHIYRPHCRLCQACVPVRVPTSGFKMSRSHKRCLKRNHDLQLEVVSTQTDEHYALYERYISQRHADGDMYPPSREQFRDFLSSEWGTTRYLQWRLQGKLLAVAVTDTLDRGLSAIYTFYDPQEESRSLGTFAILQQIRMARELGLDYVYLGYWIRESEKMRYKSRFRPLQRYVNNHWLTFE